MSEEYGNTGPETSFHATGVHRSWCTDHHEDKMPGRRTDEGWCCSESLGVPGLEVSLVESSRDDSPAIELVDRDEQGQYGNRLEVSLEDAPDLIDQLQYLVDTATPADEKAVEVVAIAYNAAGVDFDTTSVRSMADLTLESRRLARLIREQRRIPVAQS